jgi:hypothetical protein
VTVPPAPSPTQRLGAVFGLAPAEEPPWHGQAAFLGVPCTVEARYGPVDDGAAFVCTARPAAPWPLSTFPFRMVDDAQPGLLARLTVEDPLWVWIDSPRPLSAAAADALLGATALPAGTLWPDAGGAGPGTEDPAVPAGGALFLAGVLPAGGWAPLGDISAALGVGLPRLPVAMAVDLPSGFPVVRLRVPLATLGGPVGPALHGAVLEVGSPFAPDAPDRVRLLGTLALGSSADIDLVAEVPLDGVAITATGRYRSGGAGLWEGLDVPGLDGARLAAAQVGLQLTAASGTFRLDRVGVEVDLEDVPVVPGIVVLDAVHVALAVVDPLGRRMVHADVTGRASIGSSGRLQLDCRGSYPRGILALGLAAGTAVDVPALLADFGVPVPPDQLPDLTVVDCQVELETGTRRLALEVTADCEWRVGPFVLHTLGVHLAGAGTYQLWLSGAMSFGAVNCTVDAGYGAGGWSFAAGLTTTTSLGELLAGVEELFGQGPAVPEFLRRLTLRRAGLTFGDEDGASTVHVEAEVSYQLAADRLVDVAVSVDARRAASADGWSVQSHGVLTLDGHSFALDVSSEADGTSITASYPAPGQSEPLDLGAVAAALGVDLAGLAPDLVPTVDAATLSYDALDGRLLLRVDTDQVVAWLVRGRRTDGTRVALASLTVDTTIDLLRLPVLGPILAEQRADLAVTGLELLVASGEVTAADLASVLRPPTFPDLGDRSVLPGTTLTVTVTVGGRPVRLSLAAPAAPETAAREPARATPSTRTPTSRPAPASVVPAAAPAPAQAEVAYHLGPVELRRVTASWAQGRIWLTLDAGLALGGLELELIGLAVGFTPRREPSVEVGLQGLAVSSGDGPARVSGGLAATMDGGTRRYDGQLGVEAAGYQLAALASYTEIAGAASLFGYAVLIAPLGGPAFCYVTGLAAGFGVNRALVLPEPDALADFPLVAAVLGDSPLRSAADPGAAIAAMGDAVRPRLGDNWFAVGVRFTSFELLNSFALVTVTFGSDVEVDVLGVSTLSVPPRAPEPIGYAELAVRASVRPSEGVLDVSGRLTPASYVLSRDCHLTGGFAFRAWFADAPSGARAGEFVVTLGGYHPGFRPPSWYPQAPRLAANWQVSSQLAVKGSYYFALTPAAVMAGGALEATWSSGDLSAWFTAHADFLLSWKPFHYEASIGVSIGVSYRIDLLFTSFTVSVSVGVDLELWGPSFGGQARVDLGVVGFSIGFGADRPAIGPISWKEFAASFLPADPGAYCFPRISGGLLKDLSRDPAHDVDWVVSPETFELTTFSVVPCSAAVLVRGSTEDLVCGTADFGVGPVGIGDGELESVHTIVFTRNGVPIPDADLPFAPSEPVLANVPAAAWSTAAQARDLAALNATPSTIAGAVTGYVLRPLRTEPDRTLPIALAQLVRTVAPVGRHTTWAAAMAPGLPTTGTGPAVLAALRRQGAW